MNKYEGHTKGPWEVVGSMIQTVGTDRERITVAVTKPAGAFGMDAKQEANAALIADAPMLLQQRDDLAKALRDLFANCAMIHRNWGEGSNQKEADEAVRFAQDLLAKIKAEPK